jgi:hypothetical protein
MKRTKLYQLGDESLWRGPYARANGMGWLEGKMDFLSDSRQKDYKEFCDIQTGDNSPGIHIDDVGREWPDILASGHITLVPFFVSERVIQSLRDEEIPFRRAIEIPVTSIESSALRSIAPPKYYVLEADIGIELGEEMKDVPVGYLPPGKLASIPAGGIITQERPCPCPAYNSWNGSPLFTEKSPDVENQQYTRLYCDHSVTFLAMKEKWTNFKATELHVI